ncbi:tryptophan ABC transporter substrate-binding protein [Limosilactobacillus fermentum]|uniref:tryptophan ABC transporter substrate-binding protein n=1 Tax=Limosilactobacillus fermentum TaxID=1613 RepID=UPI00062DB7B9|nr:tryptophan ABC transporter substrate-binding protein [Limosilactobacillus fermentum]KLD55057.1 peptide ABC transporter substrate-binding protein [Limosilactobacillus fermentum]MCT3430453.1 ABC transporter substrate-binding protein [Limosilactobacillus fermentum]MDC6079354.1 tryptophan ABC transporter substrate-binding protein [Limosilactobacillus fermentum]
MKRMYTLIVLLVAFLGVAFSKEGGSLTTTSKPKIGVLTLMHHPALDQIYKGFVDELAKEGYKDGKNVTIEYQNAQGDQSNLKTMATKLVNDHSTVLFGITTPASQALANATTKIPIVLGAVTDPKGAGLIKNDKKPGGNITGISNQAPVADQLHLVHQFMPNAKTLGIIYTSSDPSAESEHKQFVAQAKKMGLNLKSYSIANSNDLDQVSQQMLSEVDAVIVPTDNTIAGAMQTLVKNADAANKPVFPAADTMVKDGGVATYSINQYKLGVAGAKVVVAILKGKAKPETTAIEYIRHGEPVLNLKQANKLGLKVPKAFEKAAEDHGEVFK